MATAGKEELENERVTERRTNKLCEKVGGIFTKKRFVIYIVRFDLVAQLSMSE